jgi:N-acetyl-anhydromuramyl-L-alanine amidase AmpD
MTQKKLQRVDYIVVHCSATPAKMDIGVDDIDRWHREQGFFKVGYHAVIRRNGKVEWGRAPNEIGAHAYGANSKSVGICLVGGMDERNKNPEQNYTPEQYVALRYAILYFKGLYPSQDCSVIGHRDVKGTNKACPSFDAGEWWRLHASD